MLSDLWKNDPDENKSQFREEVASTNYKRVYYLLMVLVPIAFAMFLIAESIGDTLSIR